MRHIVAPLELLLPHDRDLDDMREKQSFELDRANLRQNYIYKLTVVSKDLGRTTDLVVRSEQSGKIIMTIMTI